MKALNDALKLIEKDLGKGSISVWVNVQSKGASDESVFLSLDIAPGSGGYPKDASLKSMDQSHLVRQCCSSCSCASAKGSSSMRNMFQLMLALVSTLTNCSCSQPDQGSKVLRLQEN